MVADQSQLKQLMTALDENRHIKAAVVLDSAGRTKARTGNARAVGKTDRFAAIDASQQPPAEDVYLVGAGRDFLAVVFDDGQDFEAIKKFVDGLLDRLGLRKG